MKYLSHFFLFLALLMALSFASAQQTTDKNNYNVARGLNALQSGSMEEAHKYFEMELEVNPKNGYASLWNSVAYIADENSSKAFSFITDALANLPKKDKEYIAAAYSARAQIYEDLLANRDAAIADYTKVISLSPMDHNGYESRANLYFLQKKYDLAEADYQKIISISPPSIEPYLGLGKILIEQKEYKKAIDKFSFAIHISQGANAAAYLCRAKAHFRLTNYYEAVDDLFRSLEIEQNDEVWQLMEEMLDSASSVVLARLKIKCRANPNDVSWHFITASAYMQVKSFGEALTYCKECYKIEPNFFSASVLANCLSDMGDGEHAMEYADIAMDYDSTDIDLLMLMAQIESEDDNWKEVMELMDECVALKPENSTVYSRRAWFKSISGDVAGAVDDYSSSIVLDASEPYPFFARGHAYLMLGNEKEGRRDLMKAIEMDTDMTSLSCAHYAWLYLGDTTKALQLLDTTLKYEDEPNYNAACIYSLINDQEKALKHLRLSFEKDKQRNLSHWRHDRDLNNIRNLPEYTTMVEEFERTLADEIKDNNVILGVYNEKVVEIPFEKKSGVMEIKCKINDLPLYFIFDTGASDVSISEVEATFMLKNNYLSEKDIVGTRNYLTANGEISEGTVISLNSIQIGEMQLHNVLASVVKSQNAPLLLGQSALQRLGKMEIDNDRMVIRFTYREEQ